MKLRSVWLYAALCLTGCASQAPIPWHKANVSPDATQTVYNQCRRAAADETRELMARDLNALTDNPIQSGPTGTGGSLEEFQRDRLAAKERQIRSEAIARCMTLHGFTQR